MNNIDINQIIKIAKKAGDKILEIYNADDFTIEYKSDNSPLTTADLASNKIILDGLKEAYPDIPAVSEEQDKDINSEAMKSNLVWVIDPIDGTKGFVKKDGQYTVNIGLLKDNVPYMGVVYAPVLNEIYYSDGDNSYFEKNGVKTKAQVSDRVKVKSAVASKNHFDEVTSKFLSQFGDIELIQAGSSLKICKVATGEADIYPRFAPTMEWDTAAAHAYVLTAGGALIDPGTGQELAYNKESLLNTGFIVHNNKVSFS